MVLESPIFRTLLQLATYRVVTSKVPCSPSAYFLQVCYIIFIVSLFVLHSANKKKFCYCFVLFKNLFKFFIYDVTKQSTVIHTGYLVFLLQKRGQAAFVAIISSLYTLRGVCLSGREGKLWDLGSDLPW